MIAQRGDRVKVTYNGKKSKKGKTLEGTVAGDYDCFTTIHQGSYIVTIPKLEVINGNITIELIEKGAKEAVAREKKIDKEVLLKECMALGWNDEAAKVIGEKYGLSKLTIKTYYGKWGIADLLAEKRDQREVDKVKQEQEEENQQSQKKDFELKAPINLDNTRFTKAVKAVQNAVSAIGGQRSKACTLKKIMTVYEGDIMEYEVAEETVKIYNEDNYENYIVVAKDELLKFIGELHELAQNTIKEAKKNDENQENQ
ncbi:MAG: hypothetical protein JJT76_12985 [Clostridiaceae bacterium]|nr:hypothetical protein [Clostridiaceae bacterium]